MIRALPLILMLAACSKAKPEPSTEPATSAQDITFAEVEARLPTFVQQGFVHSLAGKTPINQRDGLFFTGLAVYGADCATGAPLAAAINMMLTSTGGAVYRDPSLPTQSILDGALAMYRAIAKRAVDCGETAAWAPLIAKHVAYMAAHGETLNVDGSQLSGGFDYVRDLLAYKLGAGPPPAAARQLVLEDLVVTTWTEADIAAKAACYRTHLALVTLQTIEELGGTVTQTARDGFCSATDGVGLPTADRWCGRSDLAVWMGAFSYNVWQYQFQRCTKWESQDGAADGATGQPGVDYLVAYQDQTQ
jgi:hypothetical protein